jgi:hypothetical protein
MALASHNDKRASYSLLKQKNRLAAASPKSDQVFCSARLLIDDAAIYYLAFERFASQLGIHLFWQLMGIPAPAHRARHTSAHERCWAEAGIDPATKQIATANRTDLSIVPSHVMTFNYSSLFNRRGWKASILCGVYVTNNLIRNGASKAGIGPTGSIDLTETPLDRAATTGCLCPQATAPGLLPRSRASAASRSSRCRAIAA